RLKSDCACPARRRTGFARFERDRGAHRRRRVWWADTFVFKSGYRCWRNFPGHYAYIVEGEPASRNWRRSRDAIRRRRRPKHLPESGLEVLGRYPSSNTNCLVIRADLQFAKPSRPHGVEEWSIRAG